MTEEAARAADNGEQNKRRCTGLSEGPSSLAQRAAGTSH